MDPSTLFRVDGLIAVVTGGATGIGLMIARSLLAAGASKIYILGRRQAALDTATTANPGLTSIQCDITVKEDLQAAVDRIQKEVGYINLLIANSGILGPTANFGPGKSVHELRKDMFENTSIAAFNETFLVNTTATYFTLLAFLELLDAGNTHAVTNSGFGAPLKPGSKVPSIQSQVIVTSSVGAYIRDEGTCPAYMGSKAAVVAMVKHACTGLSEVGIRVNALAPGCKSFTSHSFIRANVKIDFPSEMANPVISHRNPETETSDEFQFIPARRFGGEEEMGGTVVYLASRTGAFCNGLVLLNDGGRVAVSRGMY
jgi:NAD(P)-dependent dehydrogenase (short-subunit alcohol dehydrogenase family)